MCVRLDAASPGKKRSNTMADTEDRNEQQDAVNEPQPQEQPIEAQGEEQQDTGPEAQVDIEDIGTWKRKVTVTVPRERIDAKYNEMYGELSTSAQIPGFRVGRAPRRLIEKRFGKEVSQDVRNALVGDGLRTAIEDQKLKTLGEPDFDLDTVTVPEEGDMAFSFEVEVAPEFELPSLEGIGVTRPTQELTDERVTEMVDRLRQMRVRYEPTDEATNEGDVVTADVKVTGEGIEEVNRPAVDLRAAPGQVEGIPLVDLGKALAGKSAGETATLTVTVPGAHPNESWRGKQATIDMTVTQVRHRVLPELDDEFAKTLGFDTMPELRDYMAEQARARGESEIRESMREQIREHLLTKTDFELPEGVLARHTARIVQRRAVDLQMRGVPVERIQEDLAELQASAGEEARRQLRLQFILARIADDKEIEVGDMELNSAVAAIAAQYNRRPERMRQELEQDGSIHELYNSIRERKVLDAVLDKANISTMEDTAAATEGEGSPEQA